MTSGMSTEGLHLEQAPPLRIPSSFFLTAPVAIAIAGLLVALRPPETIRALATEALTGLAVLFPTTIAALYGRRATAAGCIASIVVGELMLGGFHYGIIPPSWSGGFLPVTPIIFVTTAVLIAASLLGRKRA